MNKLFIFIIIIGLFSYFNRERFMNRTFHHNRNVRLTQSSYHYVLNYKRQLVKNISRLLNDLDIKFVIGHGNLLEYERQKPIYHDDDVDIRFDVKDMRKWKNYCQNITNKTRYNLIFDDRFQKIEAQMHNGIQARLKYSNEIDVHLDLVASEVDIDFWKDYDIDFTNLRKIKYLGCDCYAPSKEDTNKMLTVHYGKDYL
ncbi:uncharacterized protein METZ01_LOCUS343080, partial [marine metagenome]